MTISTILFGSRFWILVKNIQKTNYELATGAGTFKYYFKLI